MNLHKVYITIFAVFCLIAVVFGAAWRDHVRDDAHRDAVLDTQKSDIAGLEQRIATARTETLGLSVLAMSAVWQGDRRSVRG